MSLIETQMATMKTLIDKMTYVSHGDMVLADHTNTFYDYAVTALSALKELYDAYKARYGKSIDVVDECIKVADQRIKYMGRVKYGDVVATRDHNIIIDVLKHIEVALVAMAGLPYP